ncbi:hypothetical protein HAX54_048178 [Datura stramonium]|uniref:Uncharacterized protein n=1 Tax=Datura stramonium TaxID=4076 RepID=A0ABS8SU29_DATST|nr:hypothetical protein [Datura stramonium]
MGGLPLTRVLCLQASCTSCGNASVLPLENGFSDSLSMLNSEKAVEELIQQPISSWDCDHLIGVCRGFENCREGTKTSC